MQERVRGLLSPTHLKTVVEMGRGYELELAQGNFPKLLCAQHVARCDGHGIIQLQTAVLKYLPIDSYAARPMIFLDILPSSLQGSLF